MEEQRIRGLKCAGCGVIYPVDGDVQSVCPDCGPRLGTLECRFDYAVIRRLFNKNPLINRRDMSMFRYQELLPVIDQEAHVPLHIGWTPLYDCPTAAEKLGLRQVLVKDDGLNPTASYKDRASAMVVARARELGYEAVCTASTGNAAASLAACCRSVHFPCILIVPQATPHAKLLQMLAFGATVIPVDGSYDVAFDLAIRTCDEFGWMNRSAGFNPYLVEGKKTGALEMAEQMGFDLPDTIFVSAGDGSIITGLCKGFKELNFLGFTDRLPRVIGVQAKGSNVLVRSWERFLKTGDFDIEVDAEARTCADSICVGEPREGIRALKAVQSVGGCFIDVTDDQILEAMKRLPLETSVFGEPASAAAYAGLIKAAESGIVLPKESAGVFVTGSGLKDIATAAKVWNLIEKPLAPDEKALDIILERAKGNEKR